MDKALVFYPPDKVPCLHPETEIDDDTKSYVCTSCGQSLVYCFKCAMDAMRMHSPGNPHLHMAPECDDAAERVMRKPFGSRGSYD